MNAQEKQAMTEPLSLALKELVIPQLLHHSALEPADSSLVLRQSQLLAMACLSSQSHEIKACVLNMLRQGWGLETLFLQTIPNAARLFHDWWANDTIDFIAVTQASYRLQELVYSLSAEFVLSGPKSQRVVSHTALLVNTPNSQHSLGLLILSQYFKRYGWTVLGASTWREPDMVTTVQSCAIDVVGVSVSDERQFAYLKQLIATLRKKSVNPNMLVMVGGPMLAKHGHLAEWLGADFASAHADQAQLMALQRLERVRQQVGKTSDFAVS